MRHSHLARNVYQYLFVYGTLRKGVPYNKNELLRGNTCFVGMGKIQGELYDNGNYPAYIRSDTSHSAWVTGEIYKIKNTARLFYLIDLYEEYSNCSRRPQEYTRCRMPVFLENGDRVNSWVYVYQQAVNRLKKIESGDYRFYIDQKRRHRRLRKT